MFKHGLLIASGLFFSILLFSQNASILEAGLTIDGTRFTEPANTIQNKLITKSSGQRLNLTSAFVKTSRSTSSNICHAVLFYRIYPENAVPPAFTEISCPITSLIPGTVPGTQEELWQNNSLNLDLLRNLTNGNYALEIYYGIVANTSCGDPANILLLNGTDPFKAKLVITAPLNIHFTGFLSATDDENVYLSWQIQQVVPDLQYFILEKSHNGVIWSVLDTIPASGIQYAYLDGSPFTGVNFYRVRAVGLGKYDYSIVRRIYVGRVENIITIYPNPVFHNLRFQMTAIIKGKYKYAIYNSAGSRLAAGNIDHDGNDNYVTLPLPEQMGKDVFWLVLYSKKEFYKQSFLVQ
jgi:hypothetical protein